MIAKKPKSKRTIPIALSLILLFLLSGCFVEQFLKGTEGENQGKNPVQGLQSINCNILIVGGGIGGVHTAYQLAKRGKESVCLFELENRLGGRILDVSFDGKETSPRIGVGARRILTGHSLVELAKELGITFNEPLNRGDLIFARGQHAESKDELAKLAFPSLASLDKTSQKETEVEDALYKQLKHVTKQHIPDFPSFVKTAVGPEGYHYLLDVSRFRGDFQYPIDTKSYLDWLKEESKFDNAKLIYPVGGMGEFINRMDQAAKTNGVRIFTSQPVKKISHGNTGYVAITPSYEINANKVILAVNAAKLKLIHGDVPDKIVKSAQFQQLLGIPVVTVTQWWLKPWWKNAYLGKEINRVWTTDHCINLMEIPSDDYGSRQRVTRTVYSDEMVCVALWQKLNEISVQAVETEIIRELNGMFPDIQIPKPLKTYVKVWPDAWYWLKAGSPFNNCDIAHWAVKPIIGEPIYLVGESYNPQRATWSEGAINSSIATLNSGFGFKLPDSATNLVCKPSFSKKTVH
jgi:monoamine oxidase